jgi:hypothetical protein
MVTYRVELVGGPCDGKQGEFSIPGVLTFVTWTTPRGNVVYAPTGRVTAEGRVVLEYARAVPTLGVG